MSKQCVRCGAELPEEASFCPVCTADQGEREPVRVPKPWRKKAAAALIAAVIVLAAAVLVWYLVSPRVYEGEAETVYEIDGVEYTLILTCQGRAYLQSKPQRLVTNTIPKGVDYAFPSQLNIYRADTGEDVGEDFMTHVTSCTVTAVPREGSEPMLIEGPYSFREVFPHATRMCDVYYDSLCGTNDVVWRLEMDNRDVLVLTQTFQISEAPTVIYSYQATPMNNLEQLQALLDRIREEVDPASTVEIVLPAIEYDGGLVIRDRSVTLRGSVGTFGGVTTFRGGIEVLAEVPDFLSLEDLHIIGQGEGTGIRAQVGCYTKNCTVTGWEIGVSVEDGGWVIPTDCDFHENGVGFRFNSNTARLAGDTFWNNTFRNNGVGLELISVPGREGLDLKGCSFTGNGEDIRNLCDRLIDLSQAEFK